MKTLPLHSRNWCMQMAVLAALTLTWMSIPAYAQQCSANFDFSEPGSPRYKSTTTSNSVAFRGTTTGNVWGRVRNGQLVDLEIRLDPDVNGPNNLRLFTLNYDIGPSVSAPSYRCVAVSNGVKLIIGRVYYASQYFSGESTYSKGYADVELTFERGTGTGLLNVRYSHQTFNRADSTPPRPHNGTVAIARPQAGARLTITNR